MARESSGEDEMSRVLTFYVSLGIGEGHVELGRRRVLTPLLRD